MFVEWIATSESRLFFMNRKAPLSECLFISGKSAWPVKIIPRFNGHSAVMEPMQFLANGFIQIVQPGLFPDDFLIHRTGGQRE